MLWNNHRLSLPLVDDVSGKGAVGVHRRHTSFYTCIVTVIGPPGKVFIINYTIRGNELEGLEEAFVDRNDLRLGYI